MNDSHSNNTAVEELAKYLNVEEEGSSSHWLEMHKNFKFEDGNVSGLYGFGGYEKPAKGLKRLIYLALQFPFYRLGRKFKNFKRFHTTAKLICQKQNRQFDLDMLRQVLSLSYVHEVEENIINKEGFVGVIGDGFGSLTSLLLSDSSQRIVLINLTKTLIVDILYVEKIYPQIKPMLVSDEASLSLALSDPSCRLIVCRADDHDLMKNIPIKLMFNIASMQEMDPRIIANYFVDMRSNVCEILFYCCNREEKKLPGGEVIRFVNYPWDTNDKIIADELCPWHQKYYSFSYPFYHSYDGPHRHRLVFLTKNNVQTSST